MDLDRLFSPSSVAIIGASSDKDKGGGFVLYCLLQSGFRGRLYPVNPRQTEVMGLKAYPSVMDIPDEVDEAVVAVAARIVPRVMAECVQKGVKYAVVHSAGFSEMGAEGRELENEMLRIAEPGGTRIVGPNCMGLYSSRARLNTILSESHLMGEPGLCSFIAQSGNVSENFLSMGSERGVGISKVMSIGNQSDLAIEDLIAYFADDPETETVGCYIEGIKRGREFLQLARRISLRKPVVVWKGGKTEAGARIAVSHTSSLAGDGTVFEAALRQSGVVSAGSMEEVIDLVVGFSCPFLPQGNRLGLIAEAGSGTVTGADVSQELRLTMPALSAQSQKELDSLLKDTAMPSLTRQNPVDLGWLTFDVSPGLDLESARIVGKEVDAVVVLTYSYLTQDFAARLVTLRDEMKKPILLVPGLPVAERGGMSLLASKGIPTFTILHRALRVLSAMVRYSDYRRQA